MNEKTMNGKKALKTALPVVIALVLVALITLTISLASRPGFNASIDDPNGAYLKLDGYVITNDKVYVNLRYNYGVSEMLAYVDEILLKDINVDRNSEEYIAVKNKLIYGENHEDLTATEKAEKLANELELYEGLRLSVSHCEEVINANKDRYPILERTNQILEDQIAHIEADIASTQATLNKIKDKFLEDFVV